MSKYITMNHDDEWIRMEMFHQLRFRYEENELDYQMDYQLKPLLKRKIDNLKVKKKKIESYLKFYRTMNNYLFI